MNSLNLQTGHRLDIPRAWLSPVRKLPTPRSEEEDEGDDEEEVVEAKPVVKREVKGLNKAKQKAYERMLADLARQEADMAREQERLRNHEADVFAQREAEAAARRQKILDDRERRERERAERKKARDDAAITKRREQNARAKAYRDEKERRVARELEEKTRKSYEVRGNKRPDGRLRGLELKTKPYMYFGDFANAGKEATDRVRDFWGKYADPDLYFWVPHGYGEFRDNQASEPFISGEMVSGVLDGQGMYNFKEDHARYEGPFRNDRPQGFGITSEATGDPDHPVSHRLQVYQRGKPVCFLDELKPGMRLKIYGVDQNVMDRVTGSRRSKLPVVPNKNAPATGATLIEALGTTMGLYRVKPDFGPSIVVNLKSTMWELERAYKPLFQGLELFNGEHEERRFAFDPTSPLKLDESDHRENLFGPSSRLQIEAVARAREQAIASQVFNETQASAAAARASEEQAKKAKEERASARRQAKAEKAKELAEQAAFDAHAAELGAEQASKVAVREAALQRTKQAAEDETLRVSTGGEDEWDLNGFGEKKGTPLWRRPKPPNSGVLLFDDQRFNFLPQVASLPGPASAPGAAKEEKRPKPRR